MKKLKDCNSIKEIYENLPVNLFSKIALVLLFGLCLYPVLSMVLLPFINYDIQYVAQGYLLIIGLFGLFICLLAFIGFLYKQNKKDYIWKNKYLILLIIFILWIFICALASSNKYTSFFGDIYRDEGFLRILSYMGIFGLAFLIKKEQIKKILIVFSIVASIMAFLSIIQAFNLEIPFFFFHNKEEEYYNFTAVFNNSNHYGYYLVMALMAIMSLFYLEEKKYKYIYLSLFFLNAFVLVLNNSFGCYLASIFGTIALIIFNSIRNKKINLIDFSFLGMILLASLLALFTPYQSIFYDFKRLFIDIDKISSGDPTADKAGSNRWGLWTSSFQLIKEHPIFGIGPDNGGAYLFPLAGSDRPHNEFIQYMLFYGIFGFILYILILLDALCHNLKNIKKLGKENYFCFIIVISYLVSSLFGNTMYYTAPYFFMFLALTISFERKNKETNTNIDA